MPDIEIIGGLDPAFFEPEELDPALVPYMAEVEGVGLCVRHPLVYSIGHWPVLNRSVNRSYRAKRAAVAKALEEQNWFKYIVLHERPYRVTALAEIQDRMTDQEYWDNVARAWIDAENIHQVYDTWLMLWKSDRPGRVAHVMLEPEQKALADLPTRLTIYRGVGIEAGVQGLSWTLSRSLAEWMANRAHEGPNIVVATGQVHKRFVLAHFRRRNEAEIVVLPHLIRKITIETLPARRQRRP
jgi:hypothetical protein